MASKTTSITQEKERKKFFTKRRKRKLREYFTAYAFIAPSVILIFIFGIFPVGFALYVSMHKWRLKQGDYLGITNYVKAVDNLAYVAGFVLGVGALIGVVFLIKKILAQLKEKKENPWFLSLPGLLFTGSIFAFFRYCVIQLPEILGIADKIRGVEKTQALFIQMLGEAFKMPEVQSAWRLFLILLAASILVSWLLLRRWKNLNGFSYLGSFTLTWSALGIGVGLLWFTYQQISEVYAAAVESGTDPGILPHVISILAGMILLGAAWLIWRSIEKDTSNKAFWFKVFATMFLLVGGWLLIGEIPVIVSSGDPDLWSGLKVTVYFSLGTVPFQLGISLFLSILLFQQLRGSNIFRILYFLPYVTPAIASAAVFTQLFSNRVTAPVNMLLQSLGMQPQQWLYEPEGVFSIIANSLGFDILGWLGGPSLALTVIIIHSIWTFVGYDTVIYLAGLGNIPRELVDAAEVDGANKWEVFRFITFPLLSPTTYFLSLMAIIGTFKAFNTIWIFRDSMALGTTDTFSVVIFLEFFEKLRYGYASALAFVLFAIILSLTFINNKIQGSRVFYG